MVYMGRNLINSLTSSKNTVTEAGYALKSVFGFRDLYPLRKNI